MLCLRTGCQKRLNISEASQLRRLVRGRRIAEKPFVYLENPPVNDKGITMSNADRGNELLTHYPIITSLLTHLTTTDVGNIRIGSNRRIAAHWTGPRITSAPHLNSITRQAHQCCEEVIALTQQQCSNVHQVRWCEKLDTINFHGSQSYNVCLECRNSTNNRKQFYENIQINSYRTTLCNLCENEEQRDHPRGIDACVCRSEVQDPYYCQRCRSSAFNRIRLRVMARRAMLKMTRRDCWGRFLELRAPARVGYCRCGRRARRLGAAGVGSAETPAELCLGCKGTVVKAQPAHGIACRRSPRIRAQRAEKMGRNRQEDII